MAFDISVAMTWILFLALFPIAFFWLRRSWRIIVRRDFSDVALKGGQPPANPGKYAPYTAAINLLGGLIIVFTIGGVLLGVLAYDTWTAIGGSTIWLKFMLDLALSRHAHPFKFGKK
jgi:putative exporter of polyketide antibiotics